MTQVPKHQWFFLSAVLLVFGWGLTTWLLARLYQPIPPPYTPLKKYSIDQGKPVYPLTHYEPLLGGRLFFGESYFSKKTSFQANLVLWGAIKGVAAVVGFDPNSHEQTKIVKIGESIEGNKIIEVGPNYIVVRNSTGEGKINLNGD